MRKAQQHSTTLWRRLYVSKRARQDVSTAIAFLATRVRAPDIDDWRKLSHLMEYLRVNRLRPLIMSADGCGILMWYVDASFAVHVDKHRCQLGHYDRSALAGIYVYLQKCMTGSTVSAYGDIRRTDPRLHFPTYVLALAYGSPGWGLNPVPMVGGW